MNTAARGCCWPRGQALAMECRKSLPPKGNGCAPPLRRAQRRRVCRCRCGAGSRDRRCARPGSGRDSRRLGRGDAVPRCGRVCRRSTQDTQFAVVHTVDTPDIGADVVRRVLDAAGPRRPGWPAPATAPPRASRRHPAQTLARAAPATVAVTKGRGPSCGTVRTSSQSTAPTWRRARISTSTRDRDAQCPGGESAHRYLGDGRGVGVSVAGAGAQRGRHRIQRDLREHFAGGRFADRPRVAGVRRPLRGTSVTKAGSVSPSAASAGRSSMSSSCRGARRYQAPALISTGSIRVMVGIAYGRSYSRLAAQMIADTSKPRFS